MNKLFTSLFAAAKAANPEKKIATVQEETVRLWNQFKKEENFEQNVEKEITRLKGIALRRKGSLLAFWGRHVSDNSSSSATSSSPSTSSGTRTEEKQGSADGDNGDEFETEETTASASVITQTEAETPRQASIRIEIGNIDGQIAALSTDALKLLSHDRLKDLHKQRTNLQKKLKNLQVCLF